MNFTDKPYPTTYPSTGEDNPLYPKIINAILSPIKLETPAEIIIGTITSTTFGMTRVAQLDATFQMREVRFNGDGCKPSYIEQLWWDRLTGEKEWRPIEVIYK